MNQERRRSSALLQGARRISSRKPQRVTITVPWTLYNRLIQESSLQGRSLSNLACHWLELQSEQRTQPNV